MTIHNCLPTSMTKMEFSVGMCQVIFLLLLNVDSALSCNEGQPCYNSDGRQGFCFGSTCVSHVDNMVRENLTFIVVVRYPEANLRKFGSLNLYIRGSGLGLNWNNGLQFAKTDSNTWRTTIVYQSSIDGYQCQFCSDHSKLMSNTLQYRIFIDDRHDMLGANFAIKFPLSASSSFFNSPPEITVFPFFFTNTGTVSGFALHSKFIGRMRNVALYTPPSFHENTYKKFPVLVVFDVEQNHVQMMKYLFEGPILPHSVSEEFVLIAFGHYNQSERMDLLTPTVGAWLECTNGSLSNNCGGCYPNNVTSTEWLWYMKQKCGQRTNIGGLGEKTLDFLVYEVVPYVQNITSGRLISTRTGILGYSLGGLMACHAAWTRPNVFRFAACQSPSLWWPMNNETLVTCDFNFINKTLKDPSLLQNRPEQSIYIDAGGAETDDPFRLTWSVIDAAKTISTYEHYALNKNVWISVYPEKIHSVLEGAMRVWRALTTLLPAPGTPNKQVSEGPPLVG